MRLTRRGESLASSGRFVFWTVAILAVLYVGPWLAYRVGAYVLGV